MRAAVCLFWGRWGLPLPYKHDIISLVGEPVTGILFLSHNRSRTPAWIQWLPAGIASGAVMVRGMVLVAKGCLVVGFVILPVVTLLC